jgi:hypothetical protein
MRRLILPTLLAFVVAVPPARAAEEPLVKQVESAIAKGKQFLKGAKKDGKWELDVNAVRAPGGLTGLVILALLTAGVPPDDKDIQDALEYFVNLERKHTYTVGIQTMVLAALNKDNRYKDHIQKNVDWLIEGRVRSDNTLLGWGYSAGDRIGVNGSNTQYVLLGLHEGINAGATVDPKVLEQIQALYAATQNGDGGWGYTRSGPSTPTMTCAGLCGLLISGMDLNASREKPLGGGKFSKCGEYENNRQITKALEAVAGHLPEPSKWDSRHIAHFYYWIYGLERVGRLSGLRFLGSHDWYREGCTALVQAQHKDGGWLGEGEGYDQASVVSTSFALLFLSKGRTPILVSKLTHKGRDGGSLYPDDWNNDRNDIRHLVDFTSRELFKSTPLGTQIFNMERMREQSLDDVAAQLLQSPVAYFNGHYAPDFGGIDGGELSRDEQMLKKYVEEGGFIFAEACCSNDKFHEGMKKFADRLFGKGSLKELPPTHPVWHATDKFAVSSEHFKLYGVEYGCKTVLIYSKDDLSCAWESNLWHADPKRAPEGYKKADLDRAQEAFQLGANILAYATGLEPPPPRLKDQDIGRDSSKSKPPPGYLKVAQLTSGENPPARRAMPNLMRHLRAKGGLEVDLEPEEKLTLLDKGVIEYKFLYLHGKKALQLGQKPDFKTLRFDLEKAGGLLLADACCGSPEFDRSFREFVNQLFPDKKLEPIPLSDDLFSEELNSKKIERVRCRTEKEEGKKRDESYRQIEPALEGIKVSGRWVVIYSKYDIGCALEKQKATDCIGYDHDSALELASAVVLYALKR